MKNNDTFIQDYIDLTYPDLGVKYGLTPFEIKRKIAFLFRNDRYSYYLVVSRRVSAQMLAHQDNGY